MKRVRRLRSLFWLGVVGCSVSAVLFAVSGWIRFEHFSYTTNDCYDFCLDCSMMSYSKLTRPSLIAIMSSRLSPGWRVTPHEYGWSGFGSFAVIPSVEWQPQYRGIFVPLWTPFASALILLFIYGWTNRAPPPQYCRQCRYDLTGNLSGKCPECGQALPVIQPIAAGTIFRRGRRVIIRRRQFKMWTRRFAAMRRWTYSVGTACLAVMWILSYFWAADYVDYEGVAADQSLSVLTVSIEQGRLVAVVDNLGSVKPAPLPASLPTAGWHPRHAGTPTTSSVHAFREKLDPSIHLATSDLMAFSLLIPFLVLLLLALHSWWRARMVRNAELLRACTTR